MISHPLSVALEEGRGWLENAGPVLPSAGADNDTLFARFPPQAEFKGARRQRRQKKGYSGTPRTKAR